MEFHRKLRHYMNRARVSQEEMGDVVGVSQNQVSRWQRGVNTPDIHQAGLVAKRLGVSLDSLVDDEQDVMTDEEVELARGIRRLLAERGIRESWRVLSGIATTTATASKDDEVLTPVKGRPGETGSVKRNKGVG